jgi:hypothetical protein
MNFPHKGYKDLKEDCPPIPDNTCPIIDEAQKKMEDLRDQNEALRDVGKFWRATSIRLLEECCDLNRYIKEIEKDE